MLSPPVRTALTAVPWFQTKLYVAAKTLAAATKSAATMESFRPVRSMLPVTSGTLESPAPQDRSVTATLAESHLPAIASMTQLAVTASSVTTTAAEQLAIMTVIVSLSISATGPRASASKYPQEPVRPTTTVPMASPV